MATFYELMPPFSQIEDGNGNPLSGGKLYFYIAGTSTPKDTYRESDGVTANANPIILDSSGYPPYGIWGTTGPYKIILKDSADVTLRTRDNVLGIGDSATAAGSYRVTGLIGVPNTVTPLTQYDITASVVQVWQPSTKQMLVVVPSSTLTNNISTSGPAANARDQSSAFTSSSWIYLYYIYNGTTLATISSHTGPGTGPTLPSGYTHWAFCGAVFLNGSTQIVPIRMRGSKEYYTPVVAALTNGSSTSEAAVSLTSLVPSIATDIGLSCNYLLTSDGSGVLSASVAVRVVTTVTYMNITSFALSGLALSTACRVGSATQVWIPNVSQNFYYLWTVNNGSSQDLDIDVFAFTVPNGDS